MKHSILTLALFTLSLQTHAAGLLPASSNDLVASRLSNDAVAAGRDLPSEELHYAWALEKSIALDTAATPFEAESREFWADHDADALQRGIRIHTTAPGALVRLSPIGNVRAPLQPADLVIERNGRLLANNSALVSVARPQDLAEGTAPFPEGSSAFRLDAALGAGEFILRAPTASDRYLVHVFEPDSNDVLKLQAATDTHLAGDSLNLRADFQRAGRSVAADRMAGVLTAPDGRSFELSFVRQRDGSYQANLPTPPAAAMGGPVLWQAHTFSSAGEILRDAKTAIAVTNPVARLNGQTEQLALRAHGTNVVVQFGIESAVSSRLQLTGTLWGTTTTGALVPVASAQTAKMVSAGNEGVLELRFMTDVVDPAGVRAPFEIRDLRLLNQADMGLLERRQRAWRSAAVSMER
jgi:hypothetical protein